MRFVRFNPALAARWFEKSRAGIPVTADEHNSVVIQVGLQRDLLAHQDRMLGDAALTIPSESYRGELVPLVGWSESVEDRPADSVPQKRVRQQSYDATTFLLWQLSDTPRLVEQTAAAGVVNLPLQPTEEQFVAVMGPVEQAIVPPGEVSPNQALLEDSVVAGEARGLYLPSDVSPVVRRESMFTQTVTLATRHGEETERASKRALWGAGILLGVALLLRLTGR